MGGLLTRQAKERERRDELLSAYLDGQLSAGERARVDARLAADPALRAELDALRRTVALVRELPPVPVPRNFILPQAVAPRPRPERPARFRRTWAAPLLTAATAVVSLMFVVVLAGGLLFPVIGSVAPAPMADLAEQEEAPRIALAPSPIAEEPVAEEAESEVQVEVTVQAEKAVPVPSVVEEPAEEEAPAEELPEALVEVEEFAAEAPEGEGAPAPAGSGGVLEETATPAPTAAPPVEPSPTLAPRLAVEETAPTATLVPMPETDDGAAPLAPNEVGEAPPHAAGDEEPEALEVERGVPERESADRFRFSPRVALEVVLGLAALGLALATIRAWRARRR